MHKGSVPDAVAERFSKWNYQPDPRAFATELHSLVTRSTTAELLATLQAPPHVAAALPQQHDRSRELANAYSKVLNAATGDAASAANLLAPRTYAASATAADGSEEMQYAPNVAQQAKLLHPQAAV